MDRRRAEEQRRAGEIVEPHPGDRTGARDDPGNPARLVSMRGDARSMTDVTAPFVPDGFEPPLALDRPQFRLRPLGPQHNESDYAAWTSSFDHIRATAGW